MSFLNPSSAVPKLGVNLASLIAIRDLRSASPALDLRHFAQAAEEAGADVIRLAVDSRQSEQNRADVELVLHAVSEVQLVMPLSREMIDVATKVRPHSVCFNALDGERETAFSSTSLHLMVEAVTSLQRASIQVVLSLDPAMSQLQAVADAGITTIEFNTHNIAQGDRAYQHDRRAMLSAAVQGARQLGLTVHLSHGIDYGNVHRLAAAGDIAQVNVGHAIAVRALIVGWQNAVREMKALLVTAGALPMRQSESGARK